MLCAIPRLRQIVSSRPWDRFSYSLASSDAALAAIIFGRFVLTFPSALCTNCLRPTVLPSRTVVVAQLVERSLPTPEIHSSNPVIGEILWIYSLSTVLNRQTERIKRPGMAHFSKITVLPSKYWSCSSCSGQLDMKKIQAQVAYFLNWVITSSINKPSLLVQNWANISNFTSENLRGI